MALQSPGRDRDPRLLTESASDEASIATAGLCSQPELVHSAAMSPKRQWTEIDTLRGFAVVFMIVNHAGVGWLDLRIANGVLADWMVLLGSYAPVLFFFVTGVGYGVSHDPAHGRRRTADVVYKAALLLVADAFWRGDGFLAVGLDFLGFIGLSMLVLHLACSGARGRAVAWSILFLATGVRFGLGPVFRDLAPADSWIQSLVGNGVVPGFSYWVAPWLAYPALGFLFGDSLRRLGGETGLVGRLVPALLLVGVASGVAVGLMASRDFVFLRFGTMSIAFFVSSITVLAFSSALAWISCAPGRPAVGAALALRGVSSFVVVPIHMYGIVLVGHAASLPLTGRVYALVMLPFVALNYGLARWADREARCLGERTPVGGGAWIATAMALVAFAIVDTLLAPGFARISLATFAQLLVGMLLTVRPPRAAAA